MGILETIIESKRRRVEALQPRRLQLRAAAEGVAAPRRFGECLRTDTVAVIAEFKRRSPSAGWIEPTARVEEVVTAYEAGGAAAVSVLTDTDFFGGALEDLEAARKVSALPALRKDFIIDEVQVYEARVVGADAVLLIARILAPEQLRDLLAVAAGVGLPALVEAHDADEVETALRAGAEILGINNRDLATFDTNAERALRIVAAVPPEVTLVAESGVRGPADVERFAAAGFDAVLVGEHLMRSRDRGAAVAELAAFPRQPALRAR